MSDPFVHLHVASGYSLQYGASHPHVLVERAAEQEMDTLALTDRDGTYGAVRFVKAAMAAGIRPILGVDLAMADPTSERGRARCTPGRPTHPGARRRHPRRLPAAPGRLPGQRPHRLGRGVPAGLGRPRRRPAPLRGRDADVHPRAGRRARHRPRRRRRAGAAGARLRAGPGGGTAPRRPRHRGAGPLARPRRARAAGRRGGLPPAARLGSGQLAARRPDGGAGRAVA